MKRLKFLFYKLYFFRISFDKKYTYKRLSSSDLRILSTFDMFARRDGYERISDLEGGLFEANVWYRKLKN